MTLLYRDPIFLEHDTGRHPENSNRLRSIQAGLDAAGLTARCTPGTFQPLAEESVLRADVPQVLLGAKELCRSGGGRLEADTPVCPRSYDVALAAAGRVPRRSMRYWAARTRPRFVWCDRPDITPRRPIAWAFACSTTLRWRPCTPSHAHGLARVLIVDWDVHHGNGTQDIFYDDGRVFFLSIHRYGGGFYPGTGAANETGHGAGWVARGNVPVRFGISRKEFREQFTTAVEKAAEYVKPELVLVSAGFDAHREDPIGGLCLEAEDFGDLTRIVRNVARVHCGGRVVSCLEGGYNLEALRDSVAVHLREMLAPTT